MIKLVALIASWVIKAWMSTVDIRYALSSEDVNLARRDIRMVYTMWHEGLIVPSYTHMPQKFAVMISTHRDGELLAQITRMMGGYCARGSSTRGGVAAVLGMLRHNRAVHLALTPDGPKGPRRKVQKGALYLASRGQMPLVPTALAIDRCWRIRSWDRMIIPKPGAKAYVVVGEAINPPPDMDAATTREYMDRYQKAMDHVQDQADQLIAGVAGAKLDLKVVHWTRTLARTEL